MNIRKTIVILIVLLSGSLVLAQTDEIRHLDDSKIKVEVYPNPTTDVLNITLSVDVKQPDFIVHNVIGNRIQLEAEKISDRHFRLNVKELAPGYYMVMFSDRQKKYSTTTLRFLKR